MAGSAINVDTRAYLAAAKRLKGADKEIQKAIKKALKDMGQPFGQFVLAAAAQQLPSSGGLAYRVASGKVTVQVGQSKLVIGLGTREGFDLKKMDTGRLRHPVFADPEQTRKDWAWVEQTIPTRIFSDPFEKDCAPKARTQMIAALQTALDNIGDTR